jgi:chemotaxis signal transduction protein/HAMP domain-containing protein
MDQINKDMDFEDDFDDDLEEWTEQKFLTFPLENEIYALSVDVVTEIIGIQEITEVPELPEYVRGIINLRGQIVPVIDLRLKFEKVSKAYDDKTCIIVIEERDISLGLIVDAVAEVVDIPDAQVVDYPQTEDANQFISAIVTAIVGLFGIFSMYSIQNNSEDMYYDNLEPAAKLSDVQVELQNIRANQILALYERNPATVSTRIAAIDEAVAKDDQLLSEYEATIADEENQALFDDLTEQLSSYRQVRNDNLALIEAGNYDQTLAVLGEVTAALEAADDSLQALIDYNDAYAQTLLSDNGDYFRTMTILMIVISIIGIALAVGLGLKLANSIATPLKSMVHAAEQIAEGDLDVTVRVDANDEVGDLGKAFEKMSQNLNEVLGNIDSAAVQVTVGAKQVADSSMALSQGATEQASSVEELSSAIEQIATQTVANAQNAETANHLAEQTRSNAVEGNSKMQMNSATSEESAAASEELSGQADLMREQVSQFKLKGGRGGSLRSSSRSHEDKGTDIYLNDLDFGKY